MENFEKCSPYLFFKSPRPDDKRLGEFVKTSNEVQIQSAEPSCILLGYPDDEGIRINYGREGSREAPDAIRASLYKLTPGRKDFPKLLDMGNLRIDGTLSEKQARARASLTQLYEKKHRLLSMGGGHDYAYPDCAAFLAAHKKGKPLIINIDAHLDVRNSESGPNSGTAFYQLLEEFGGKFDLVELGIQPGSASLTHLEYAKRKKVKVYTFAETHQKLAKVFQTLAKTKRPTFLSIDIDGFAAAYAPGASAASPIGLDANEFINTLPQIIQKFDLRGVGIYEVSPKHDIDNRTAKLAAIILHTFLLHVKN